MNFHLEHGLPSPGQRDMVHFWEAEVSYRYFYNLVIQNMLDGIRLMCSDCRKFKLNLRTNEIITDQYETLGKVSC